MENILRINGHTEIPLQEISFTFARSSGAGGQNVNKTNSKAILRWDIKLNQSLPFGVIQRFTQKYGNKINDNGELVLHGQQHRDQERNRQDCLDKLREMILSVFTPPKPRKKTKVGYGKKLARKDSNIKHKEKKNMRKKIDY